MSDYEPMKAVLVHAPFSDPAWIFERKLDGVRCGVVRRDGVVRLLSRGGEVLDDAYPDLVEALGRPGPDLVASPFAGDDLPRPARWAEPDLVAEIEFTEWTRHGRLRHPRYLGLRFDKPAREVVREEPATGRVA
jgi:ATP-dependent DNA ligase